MSPRVPYLLADGKHGFRTLLSTLTQLLPYWDPLLNDMESGKEVGVIYNAFSKGFYTVYPKTRKLSAAVDGRVSVVYRCG